MVRFVIIFIGVIVAVLVVIIKIIIQFVAVVIIICSRPAHSAGFRNKKIGESRG